MTSRTRPRSGSSTTPATTRARSTGCSSTSTSTSSGREQERLRGEGVYRGVGFSTWVEVCGLAPSRAVGPQGVGLQAAFWESANVRVTPTGSAIVYTGTSPHGQGLDTSFAQIAGDILGIDPAERGRAPRRHRPGHVGLGHVRLALAGGGRRGDRARRAAGAGQGQADLRRAARGGARGHRARRRQVPGARLAGQVDDDGRDLRRGAHPAERAARPTSSRGSRRARSTTRRTSCSRSARTRAWSTWTPRPAR